MIKRLLNPHTLLKITLILTTLLLLPTSSWANVKFQTTGAPFKPDGAPQSGTQKYEWNVNRTSSKWEISFGASLTLTDTGFKANLYDTSTNRSVSISGLTKPTSGTCKIKKISLSGLNLSNCNITTKIGDSYQFQRSGTTDDFSPNGNDTYYQWSDNSSSINITIARNSSDVEITVSSITVEVTDIDDDNTEFRWPESVNGFVFNHDFNSLTVDAGLLQTFSYPLELSDFSGVTAASTSRDVTYRSSEQQIATIDNGEITLRKIGETVITATVNDNNDYHYTNGHKEYSFTLISIFQGPTLSLEEGIQNFGSPIYMTFPGDYNAVSIKYKWQDESEQTYDPQNPPTVKAGELTAWGEITNNGTIIKSEVVTATYVASYDITIAGTAVTSNNAGNILSGGVNDEKVSYNHEKNTLTLNSAKLTDDIVCNTTSLFIDIQGHNTITTNGKPAITTTLETSSPQITIKSTSETKGSLVLKNTSTETTCGGVFRGSSTIITVYTDNPIATLLPTDQSYLTSDTTHIAVFGEFYNLTIGNMKVGSTNTTDILGDGKVTYNPDKQTLSLNGVTIPRIQCTANHPLKIEISGTNTVGMMSGSGYENNTLTITKKKGDSSSASLDVDSNGEMLDGMSPICHFSKCTWDEGLYLNAYTYTYNNDVPEKTSISGVYYGKKGSNYNFISPAGDNIGGLAFSENKPTATPSIWIGGLEPNGEGKFTFDSDSIAGASFDANSNTLTLSGALIYYKGGNIVSSLPSLTIKLTGGDSSMGEYKIINTNPQATLKFTTIANNPGSISNSLGNNELPWEGFSGNPTFENKLVYLPNHDTQFIKVLEAPTINYSDGNLIFGGLSDGYGQNYFDCHYTITYGDGSTDSGQNNGQVPSLSVPKQQLTPCTITAYTEFTDQFNNKTTSDIATAYYFGFADDLKVTFDGTEMEIQKSEFPKLIPVVENIDFILSNSTNTNVIYLDNDGGHIKKKGLGTTDLVLNISHNENTQVLNSGGGAVYLTAKVIPSAPTFSVVEGTYDETQTLTLSSSYQKSNSDDQTVVNIKYYTSEDPNKHNPYTDPISIDNTTTITAWVEALITSAAGGTQEKITSDTITQEYIIKEEAFIDFMQEENDKYITIEAGQVITGTYGNTIPQVVMPSISDLHGTITFSSSNEIVVASSSISLDEENKLKYTVSGAGQTTIQASYTPTEEEPILPTTSSFNLKIEPRAITNATISMGTNGETSFVYKGTAIEPITSVSLAASETAVAATLNAETDFDLNYYMVSGETETEQEGAPTNVGSYKVTVNAKGNYTGSKSATFTITPATITPKVVITGWAYGATANTPTVSGNTGNGSVTYEYKLQNAEDSKYSTEVPTEAGEYTIKATIAATTNYEAAIDSTHFTISKANITPTVTLVGWTFGATANTPEVTGNTGNGAETFTYKAEGAEAFTSEVPTAVGTHIVKVTIAETTNYNGGEATTTFTITNRTIDPEKDITFAEGQSYASFYSADEDLELPEEGIAVFMITGLNGNTLTTQAVSYIPKGVPVLVMKASGTTQAIDPNEVSSNMLQYATSDVNADGTAYILYNGEYVRATGTIPAGKCYLKLNKPSGARKLTIGNETTGIDRLDNTVWATENWFDLNGRRIEKPTKKGLYIMNGKKVVVK